MIQIISDKPSSWAEWLCGVMGRLEEYPPISRMVIVAETDADDDVSHQIIEFMNCSPNDVYQLGGLLQKESIKHELLEELGIDDDAWEEDEDE